MTQSLKADDIDAIMAELNEIDPNNETIDAQENNVSLDAVNRKSRRSRNSRKREKKRLKKQKEAAQALQDNVASLESDTEPAQSSAKEPSPNVSMSSAPAPSAPLVHASDSQPSNTNVLPSITNVTMTSRPAVPTLFTPELLKAIRDMAPDNLRPLLSDPKVVTDALVRLATPRADPQCPREVRGKQCGDPFEVRKGVAQPYCPTHMKTRIEYERDLADKKLMEEARARMLARKEIAELVNVVHNANQKKRKYMETIAVQEEQKKAAQELKAVNKFAKQVNKNNDRLQTVKSQIVDEQEKADEVVERVAKKPRLFDD